MITLFKLLLFFIRLQRPDSISVVWKTGVLHQTEQVTKAGHVGHVSRDRHLLSRDVERPSFHCNPGCSHGNRHRYHGNLLLKRSNTVRQYGATPLGGGLKPIVQYPLPPPRAAQGTCSFLSVLCIYL